MAEVKLENINKVYPNGFHAVHNFNLSIKDKEFIVFVGPSGCGKTTTLRMIAGLEEITSGKLYIDNRLCNDENPKDRDIAMVFQSYALYPHMTVYKNMAFGLKMRLVPNEVLDENNSPVLAIDERKIHQLEKDLRRVHKFISNSAKDKKTVNKKIDESINRMQHKVDHDAKLNDLDKDRIRGDIKTYNEYRDNYNKDYESRLVEMNEKIKGIQEKIDFFKKTPVPKYVYKHIPKDEIDQRVHEAAQILEIEDYLDRKPFALSGGQRQRVALGRAIVRKAKVFLMDEPLSNLDAKLRVQMRAEIIKLHERINATTIYVTHDQTEAMTMATRIVVMKDGYVQQIGTPMDIYNHPANKFVAGFIGSPSMNFYNTTYTNGTVSIEDLDIKLPKQTVDVMKDYQGQEVILGIRPEDVKISLEKIPNSIQQEVQISELLGSELILHFSLGKSAFCAKVFGNKVISAHTNVYVTVDPAAIHFFDLKTEKTIC